MSEPIRVEFANDLYPATRQPLATVDVANALDGHWTRLSYIERVKVREACAPEYGEASFSRAYGTITRADRDTADGYAPLDLLGKYVRIRIPSEDGGGSEEDPDEFVWHGIIERNAKDLLGDMQDNAAGYQTFTAYGLLRVLDRVLIDSAMVRDPDGTLRRIQTPRPFNLHRLDGFIFSQNRSTEASTDGVYTFTPDPLFSAEWTAYEAVRYLLKHHGPLDGEGNPACNLSVRGPLGDVDLDAGILSWFKLMADTTGRSVKQLLDQLIPRTRGVGYFVGYEEPEDIDAEDESGRGTITINLFTFVSADLILRTPQGDDVVLPENPNQVEWDFERDASVTSAHLEALETLRYDTIVVEGANITATGTFALDLPTDNPIVRDWTQRDENLFKAACSPTDGYMILNKAERYARNASYRAFWEPNVFKAWRINPGWGQVLYDLVAEIPEAYYHMTPSYVDESEEVDPLGDPEWRIDRASYGQTPFSNRDVRFLDYLPIHYGDSLMTPPDRPADPDSGGEYDTAAERAETRPETGLVRALVVAKIFPEVTDPESRNWVQYDVFPHVADPMGSTTFYPTAWRVVFEARPDWPGFYLKMDGGPRTFLGKREWTVPAEPPDDYVRPADTDPLHHPRMWGVAWQELYVTATLDLGVKLRAEVKVNTPGKRVTGRTLRIALQDARLDTIVPKTILAIYNGLPHQNSQGKVIRDDRIRIHRIATAAAIWYGAVRQQLTVARKRLSIPRVLRLGTLVVRTGLFYGSESVNTPITSIDIDTEEGSVTWQTGFVELDLSP